MVKPMHTYKASRNGQREPMPGTREWVFPLLATPRFRDRIGALSMMDLGRRPGCEETLGALVTDKWTPHAVHHLGWCESCRRADVALGESPPRAMRPSIVPSRRVVWGVAAAGLAIGVPVIGAQLVGNPFDGSHSQIADRGGFSQEVGRSPAPGAQSSTGAGNGSPGTSSPTTSPVTSTPATTTGASSPTTTPASTGSSGANGTTTGGTPGSATPGSSTTPGATTTIIPKPRARPVGGATTVKPAPAGNGVTAHPAALPHTT